MPNAATQYYEIPLLHPETVMQSYKVTLTLKKNFAVLIVIPH